MTGDLFEADATPYAGRRKTQPKPLASALRKSAPSKTDVAASGPRLKSCLASINPAIHRADPQPTGPARCKNWPDRVSYK